MINCRTCETPLNDTNWLPSKKKRGERICRLCSVAYRRAYREKNIERSREHNRNSEARRLLDPEKRAVSNKRNAEWHKKNPEYSRNWRLANPISIEKKMYDNAKTRAKKSGVPFTILETDIQIPDKCPVLGIPLFKGNGLVGENSPTLDKLIPSMGYIPGNVTVISFKANTAKSNLNLDELRLLVEWLEGKLKP